MTCSPQFNAVSYRVISTVLIDSEARPTARARVIAAWVDVAQVLCDSLHHTTCLYTRLESLAWSR